MNRSKKQAGGWVLVLFGLPFLGFGLGFGGWKVWPELVLWQAAEHWSSTEGELLSHRLESHRGDEGSTTYAVSLSYRYEVSGMTYQAHRLGVHGGKDNIGSYHQQWHGRLNRIQQQGGALTVWYDPANPAEALIDRDLRWGFTLMQSAFALVFTLVGAGLMAAGVFGRKAKHTSEDVLTEAEPLDFGDNAPISPGSGRQHWGLWGFAVVWNLISLPACLAAWEKVETIRSAEDAVVLVMLLFPLAGVFLAWQALRMTLLHVRYGKSRLRLDPFPGQAGGQVGGEVELSRPLPMDTQCEVRLECRNDYETRNSKGQKTMASRVMWQDVTLVRGRLEAGRTLLRFVFDVPGDQPPTEPKSSNWHHWQLHVAADIPGLDLALDFPVPVETGAEASRIRIPGRERQQQMQRSQQLAAALNIEQQGEILYMNSEYGREWGSSLALSLFGAIFFAVGVGIGFADMGPGIVSIPTKLLFCTAFGGIGGLILLMGALTPTTRLDTAVEGDQLHVKRSFLGREIYRKTLPIDSITTLEAKKSGSSSTNKRTQNWFRLVVTSEGRRQPIAESIPSRVLADEALAFLRQHTLLP